MANIEAEMQMFSDELKILEKDLAAGRVVLAEYQNKKACIEDLRLAPMVRFTLWAIRIKDLMFVCKNG
jgi:hypothetical protein